MPISPGGDIEMLMASSGWLPTQGAINAVKVNLYADDMAQGNWQWLPLNRLNPIILDRTGKIMSGHHRLVAACLAAVVVPEAAIQYFPGATARPSRPWRDVLVI